jgi:hypothetical protein
MIRARRRDIWVLLDDGGILRMQDVHVIDEFLRGMHRLESVRVDETGCPDNVDADGIFGAVVTSDDNTQYTPVLIIASDSTINSCHTVCSKRVAEYSD